MAEAGLTLLGGGGANVGVPMHSGRWYLPTAQIGLNATLGSNGFAIYVPYLIGKACTLNGIGINITVAGEAGSVVRLGLYTDLDGEPGALVSDFGTVIGTGTGAVPKVISQAVVPGWYWTSVVPQVCPVTPPTYSTPQSALGYGRVGATTIQTNQAGCYFEGSISGALPANAGAGLSPAAVTSAASVWLKAA